MERIDGFFSLSSPIFFKMLMKKERNKTKQEWWQNIFNQDYIKTYIDTTPEEITNQQVSFLIKKLKPISKKKILDLGCGYGRHSLMLAKSGCSVTGLDYSKHFLKIAKENAKKEKIGANFIFGDMRKLPFKNEFDAVICMFTSFGYFYNHKDHDDTIKGIVKALKNNSLLILDLNNPARRLEGIIKKGKLNKKTGVLSSKKISKLSNDLKVTIIQEFNLLTMRWKLIRKWNEGKRRKEYTSDIYLFMLPEIKYLLERNGLRVEIIFGDFDGSLFNFQSRRLIILARKII